MAYEINKTNGATVVNLEDNTTETVAGIDLIGKSTRNYGEQLNENLVKLIENFSNSSPPSSTLVGQLWWDTANNRLMVKYNSADLSTSWKPVSTPTIAASAPSTPATGDLWYDSAIAKLKLWNGVAWIIIGPQDSAGGSNGVFADNLGGQVVLYVKINGAIVAIISGTTITPVSITNFPTTINPGITLRSTSQLGQINVGKLSINSNGIIPTADLDISLGSSDYQFNNVYSATFTGQATSAATVATTSDSTDVDRYVTFVISDAAGDQAVYTDSGITYNPNLNKLTLSGVSAGAQLQSTTTDNDVQPILVSSTKMVQNLQAETASKWHTARTLGVSGAVSGSASVNGSSDVTIATSITAATINALLPPGIILMWSGSPNAVPNGWLLCIGPENGTPDLRDKFVVGAGSTYQVGNTGGSKDAVVISHLHTGTTDGQNQNHTHAATSTVNDPGHVHEIPTDIAGNISTQTLVDTKGNDESIAGTPTTRATTGITVSTTVGVNSVGHTHTFNTSTVGSDGTDRNLPPYYALCYIMKVAAT